MDKDDAAREIAAYFLREVLVEEAEEDEDYPIAAEDRPPSDGVDELAESIFSEAEKIGIDPSGFSAEQVNVGDDIVDEEALRSEVKIIGPDEALERLSSVENRPNCSLRMFSTQDLDNLVEKGRVLRLNIFEETCADTFPDEIDRLIHEGLIAEASDRLAPNGTPTEWITNQGIVWTGHYGDSAVLRESRPLSALYESMVSFAEGYNLAIEKAGEKNVDNLPPKISPEGVELNVNCVLGAPAAQWRGLHLHKDMFRFTDGLQGLSEDSIRHAAIRSRALTISVYFRREDARSARLRSPGGALVFVEPTNARKPGERAIFDIVLADHNSGAIFLPSTVHGVGGMPQRAEIRYSAQAFFPELSAWENEIRPRIEAGELEEELQPS